MLYYSAMVAGLSGFLFGFDTVVISGAEQRIQKLWDLTSMQHGLAISMALWGTVLGALIGGWPSDRLGRRITLMLVGFLFLLSALGTAIATEVYSFMLFRFLGGVGIGMATIAAPVYLAEISPAEKRGQLTGLFQFNIVLGILMAYVSNALLGRLGDESWRYMLGIQSIPSILFMVCCIRLPESPRWLIVRKQNIERATEVFKTLNPHADEKEIQSQVQMVDISMLEETSAKTIFSSPYKRPVLLAFFIALFNQLSGINAILYFAPRIFEMTGMAQEASMLQSVGIGLVNLIFTFIGLWLIDRAGRKTLLYWGVSGYIVSLGLCSWAFATQHMDVVPYCIFAFIASHAIGQGAVIWVFISEIFPNTLRDMGQTLGSFTHWIFAALLTLFFPKMVNTLSPALIFSIFCFLMVLQLCWIKFWVPETKGVLLEEMDKQWK